MRLATLPGVFRPRSDSRLLAQIAAERTRPGSRVLDPFTGSGILALATAGAGAGEVTAVDVSRRAVFCVRLNAVLNRVVVRALRGDLFGPVEEERFDLIVANPPYLPSDDRFPPRGAARAWDAGADGRLLLDRLCAEVPEHLSAGGELLLVQSSICGLGPTLSRLAASGLETEVIHRERGPLGPLLASRVESLESQGLLQPGESEEEIQVISARGLEPAQAAADRPHMAAAASG